MPISKPSDVYYDEVLYELTLASENENTEFVMSAWIADIQIPRDASGDIHVGLDSSTPCWNDA